MSSVAVLFLNLFLYFIQSNSHSQILILPYIIEMTLFLNIN